jgi:hypothetical protein
MRINASIVRDLICAANEVLRALRRAQPPIP